MPSISARRSAILAVARQLIGGADRVAPPAAVAGVVIRQRRAVVVGELAAVAVGERGRRAVLDGRHLGWIPRGGIERVIELIDGSAGAVPRLSAARPIPAHYV